MKNEELDSILKQHVVPPASETAKERALVHARYAFANAQTVPDEPERASWIRPAFVAAALATLLMVYLPRGANDMSVPRGDAWGELKSSQKVVLDETLSLFPASLSAVVSRNGKDEVRLREESGQGERSQPLLIEFDRKGEKVRILSFSGESVEVDLGGKREKVEVLVTGDDKVIISGENFMWSEESEEVVHGYEVRAAPLEL